MLVRLLVLAAIVAAVVWVLRKLVVRPGSDLRCASCRHCRKLFEDGSLCGYGQRETFKNIVHIENCPDHQPR